MTIDRIKSPEEREEMLRSEAKQARMAAVDVIKTTKETNPIISREALKELIKAPVLECINKIYNLAESRNGVDQHVWLGWQLAICYDVFNIDTDDLFAEELNDALYGEESGVFVEIDNLQDDALREKWDRIVSEDFGITKSEDK